MADLLTTNEVTVHMDAVSQNEGFARLCAAAFAAPLNPTVSELSELKTAVSEAVTNAILHGYRERAGVSRVALTMRLDDREVTVTVRDEGSGIADITQAREPLYTTMPEAERSGMGFTVMESFMDSVEVHSTVGLGTEVVMRKRFADGQDVTTD